MKITKALVKKIIGYVSVVVLVSTYGSDAIPFLSSMLAGV